MTNTINEVSVEALAAERDRLSAITLSRADVLQGIAREMYEWETHARSKLREWTFARAAGDEAPCPLMEPSFLGSALMILIGETAVRAYVRTFVGELPATLAERDARIVAINSLLSEHGD